MTHTHGLRAAVSAHHVRRSRSDDVVGEVFQVSTLGALTGGGYDGHVRVGELLRHGDTGVGTFAALDGEMVVVHGVAYRVRADGTVTVAAPDDLTPFAAVTRFREHAAVTMTDVDAAAVQERIEQLVDTPDGFCAVVLEARFAWLQVRAVAAQQVPYPSFAQVTAGQHELRLTQVSGTACGFRVPDHAHEVAGGRYHLHAVDDARRTGGHVLDYAVAQGTLRVGTATDLHVALT